MQGHGQGQCQRQESKASIRGQVRGWVTVRGRGEESKVRAILGSDCRVRVRGRGQESKVRAISRARVQGKGKSQRVKGLGRARSKVGAIPRTRVQGQGKGHKEGQGKKLRFRSQK